MKYKSISRRQSLNHILKTIYIFTIFSTLLMQILRVNQSLTNEQANKQFIQNTKNIDKKVNRESSFNIMNTIANLWMKKYSELLVNVSQYLPCNSNFHVSNLYKKMHSIIKKIKFFVQKMIYKAKKYVFDRIFKTYKTTSMKTSFLKQTTLFCAKKFSQLASYIQVYFNRLLCTFKRIILKYYKLLKYYSIQILSIVFDKLFFTNSLFCHFIQSCIDPFSEEIDTIENFILNIIGLKSNFIQFINRQFEKILNWRGLQKRKSIKLFGHIAPVNDHFGTRNHTNFSQDTEKNSSENKTGAGCQLFRKQYLRDRLGRSTWILLHTIAHNYEPIQSVDVKSFIILLTKIFPCKECREHFKKLINSQKENLHKALQSNQDMQRWMCKIHNIVNERLQKDVFDCRNVNDEYGCGCD